MRQGLIPSSKLRFPPPTLVNPIIWEPNAGTGFQQLKVEGETAGRDVLVKPPASSCKRGLSIKGDVGNVVVIGLSVDLSQEGAIKTEAPLRITNVRGGKIIHVEGTYLHGGGSDLDCFDYGGTTGGEPWTQKPIAQVQNCRFEGVVGSLESGVHPDLMQAQGSSSGLRVDKFTGHTGYQGIIGDGSANVPVGEWDFHRMNLGYWTDPEGKLQDNGFLLYYHDEGDAEHTFSGTFDRVYLDRGASTRSKTASLLWPGEGHADGVTSPDGVTLSVPGITGVAIAAAPPGGDFVTKSDCGVGYVSPGYL